MYTYYRLNTYDPYLGQTTYIVRNPCVAAAAMVAEVPCNLTPGTPLVRCVVDSLPRPCLTAIAGQIVCYLTLGVLGACKQAP